MTKGINGKLLFVDLTEEKIWDEEIDTETIEKFVGGYGIGAKILYERMKPGINPLGEENILGFMTGAFNGTGALSGGRSTVFAKSPLTGGWGDANTGGYFGNALKQTGFDGVFFQGISSKPVYLYINEGNPELKDASNIWGKNSFETEESIKQELDNSRIRIACIGQAGEKLSLISGIMNDKGRASARSGLGAVMGSKKLKAVAVSGKKKPELADEELLKKANQQIKKVYDLKIPKMEHFMVTKCAPIMPFFVKTGIVNKLPPFTIGACIDLLKMYGTAGFTEHCTVINDAGVKNWKGSSAKDFPRKKVLNVAGDMINSFNTKNFACGSCPLACGAVQKVDHPKYGYEEGHKPEFETLAAFGPMCLVDDTEAVLYANHLCNLYGFDTISMGTVIAFAMECFEKGIITKEDTGGIDLTWGNADAMIQILEKMAARDGIGDILADGVKVASEKLGKGSEEFAMHVGGQELGQHDPRLNPGFGLTAVTDATPGKHTPGGTGWFEWGLIDPMRFHKQLGPVAKTISPSDRTSIMKNKWDYEESGLLHICANSFQNAVNVVGLCMFPIYIDPDFPVEDLVSATMGLSMTFDDFLKMGERVNTIRHCFNLREGFKPSDFRLPDRIQGAAKNEVGAHKGVNIDVEGLKKRYYTLIDWDYETGLPSKEKIAELGLENLVGDLYK